MTTQEIAKLMQETKSVKQWTSLALRGLAQKIVENENKPLNAMDRLEQLARNQRK